MDDLEDMRRLLLVIMKTIVKCSNEMFQQYYKLQKTYITKFNACKLAIPDILKGVCIDIRGSFLVSPRPPYCQ